ncbi:hypothetical protein ACJW30_06G008800 [Castanea mollissima]
MKQKIVIKLRKDCDKCLRKAMKIACKANGVNSVAIEGSDRDQLVVIGEDVDSANLTCSLRKKLCYADLWRVEEEKPKPEPEENPKPQKPEPELPMCPQYPPYPMLYEAKVYNYSTPSPSYCPIM